MLAAALDSYLPVPPEPRRDTPMGRRVHRRWLAVGAAHGLAPRAPARIDELMAAADAARRAGRHDEARDLAAQAATLVPARCVGLATRIAELRAGIDEVGSPPDEIAAALTPAELRVAEVVVTGVTNREAAARLFLSAKTVDFHLQTIYRKLAVRSRTELATLLAARGRST